MRSRNSRRSYTSLDWVQDRTRYICKLIVLFFIKVEMVPPWRVWRVQRVCPPCPKMTPRGKKWDFSALAYRATNGELRNLIFLRLSKRYLEPKNQKKLAPDRKRVGTKIYGSWKGHFWTRGVIFGHGGQTLRACMCVCVYRSICMHVCTTRTMYNCT